MANKNSKNKMGIGVGMGMAALAGAAAYYFYGSKKGKERRDAVKNWTIGMKDEVMARFRELKEINKEAYENIVDEVSERYKKMKDVDAAELVALVATIKNYWDSISKKIYEESKNALDKDAKDGPSSKRKKPSGQGGKGQKKKA